MKNTTVGIGFGMYLLCSVPALGSSPDYLWSFDTDAPGSIALDFTGESGQWEVRTDVTAPSQDQVLAQLAENRTRVFNVALAARTNLLDVDLAVSFKSIGGRIDQGGGLVWRAEDAANYYIARFNPLEANFRVYKIVAGRRAQLASADVEGAQGWHELRVTMLGNHIRGYLDGRKYLDVRDDTFDEPGQVGLWTKADAQTHFDDFRARAATAPVRWESSFTLTTPEIDGVVDDVWEMSKPLSVVVREAIGGQGPREVVLRSLHTNQRIYVLAQWPDTTRSDMRDPYIWNTKSSSYDRPSKPDDQFALEFPIHGDFRVSMLPDSSEYVADVWHWKAGRGNSVGWVDDKRHVISHRPIDQAKTYSLGGHGTVYIARLADAGSPSYVLKRPPTEFRGEIIDSFTAQQPSGSLADVQGKGVHDGRGWTLEMNRLLNTHQVDDAVLDPRQEVVCAIAVLDDELYWRHSVSPLLELHFLPAQEAR